MSEKQIKPEGFMTEAETRKLFPHDFEESDDDNHGRYYLPLPKEAAAPSPVLTPNCKHEHAEMFWDGLHCSACNARYYDGRWKEAPVLPVPPIEDALRAILNVCRQIDEADRKGDKSVQLNVAVIRAFCARAEGALRSSSPAPAVAPINDPLLNLLAVIHRDGGHYVAEHGLDKAVEDAEKIIANHNAASPEVAAIALRKLIDISLRLSIADAFHRTCAHCANHPIPDEWAELNQALIAAEAALRKESK